ncbi:DNA ligase 1-like [Plectropomus leopardus]|uniref:DNA ligase 1-like n=1 Tax=Plectropomus leopardus TaxID=160734 RepID=UPI001C4CA785|nr:DNA ligase 1-like [Plectropomus leopardus]
MKWKRCRSRLSCEEEEEEDLDRRSSLRKKQRVSYIQDVYDDDEEEEEEEEDGAYEEKEDEEEEDQEDNEQPGTSTHNHKAQENGLWPVTCGSKKGILHVEKLASDKACIKSDSGWFGLRAFEIFGGKASSKKWKTSIYYKKKPLQFWIEQGALTINNYKRRETATIKKRKSSSPICKSESTSEELELQSADETEEDDVEEEWLSSSGKLAPETQEGEEERVGAENGDFEDSGDDNWNEKEEEMGEKEDEDMPASKEREAKMIISASDIVSAIAKKKVRVAIKRLPEFQATRDCKSDSMEHPQEDSWCKPLDEDTQSEYSHSSKDDDQMSEPSIFRGVKEENGEESTQNNERKEYGQREIKTETPPSSPVATTPDIKPEILDKTENFRLNSIHTADLNTSSAVTDTLSIQGVFKEETIEGMSELAEYGNTDAMTSDHDAAHLQVMAPETRVPQDSDSAQGPVSTYSNLDTMDLDQLKREKIKMQLKVLKLQDEYYSLKIEKLKKNKNSSSGSSLHGSAGASD